MGEMYEAAKKAVEIIKNSGLDEETQDVLARDAQAYASGMLKGYQVAVANFSKGGGSDGKTA